MRKLLLLSFLALFSYTFLLAQSSSKWTIAASINPTFTTSINTTSSSDIVNGTDLTYKRYNDSVRSKEGFRFDFGFTAWFNYMLNQKWDLQAGIGYTDVGFQRSQNYVKFGDKLYPGIGNGYLIERSGNEKNIDYNYRYQYLHIPVLFNYKVKRSGDYKMIFSLSMGAAIDVLLDHKITAISDFYVDNEQKFQLDSTGYNAYPFAFTLMAGGRMDYKIDKKISLMIQPILGFYPISVSSSPINVFPFYFSVNVGIIYDIAKK